MLEKSMSRLASQLKKHAGTSVTYVDGTASTQLTAIVGKTELDLLDSVGADLHASAIDFIIESVDLDLGSGPVEPRRGANIVLCRGQMEFIHEVVPLEPGQQCFSYSDPYRKIMRIHTQQIDVVS